MVAEGSWCYGNQKEVIDRRKDYKWIFNWLDIKLYYFKNAGNYKRFIVWNGEHEKSDLTDEQRHIASSEFS